MNIKEKLFLSWNICLIVLILLTAYFSISWYFDNLLQLSKLNGALEYIVNTKENLTQEDVDYFLNQIKEIETN